MKKIIVILLGLICLPAASAFALKLNDSAPAFSLGDSAGKDFYLSDVVGATRKENGQGIVLGFFASWCAPCRNELPLINFFVDDLRKKGITVVIVGVKEDFDRIKGMLVELKVDKPVVLSDRDGKTTEKYGVRFLPTTFFIGADGTVKDVIYGEIKDEKELMDSVQKLLLKK